MHSAIPSRYHHAVLGILLGLWLYALLVFLAPHDAAPISLEWRLKLMFGYGVIFALTYQVAHLINERVFKTASTNWWTGQWWFLLIFIGVNFPFVFGYYKTPLVLGEYGFVKFATEVYLTTLVVIAPLMIYGRRQIEHYSARLPAQIILRGENKLDVLQLAPEDLLYVETARNYVEIHYKKEGKTSKKLLRTTLKKVSAAHPDLLRVHRSFLVNSMYVTGWRDAKSITIGDRNIPVSDSYRDDVLAFFETHP